ncbi:MAG: transporter [Pseudomonadota bacterium]
MKILAPLLLLAAASVHADEVPVAPYRPSVSSPAQLPVAGQLEFEAGGLHQRSDGAHRNSLPYLFKLAFSEQWGVLVGGEAYVSDGTGHGVGDTSLVLKHAYIVDEATALGLELGAKLPTAKDSIGSGKADYSVNGIVSRDIGAVHMDVNLNLTRFGLSDPDAGRTQGGASASFSTPLAGQWGVTGELSGTRRSGAPGTAQVLLAFSFAPTKRLVIDIGMAHGLNHASTDWQFFSGMVLPMAKLW